MGYPKLHLPDLVPSAGIGPITANEIECRKPAVTATDSLAVGLTGSSKCDCAILPKTIDRDIQITRGTQPQRPALSSGQANSYALDRSQSICQRASSQFSGGLGPFGGQIRKSI